MLLRCNALTLLLRPSGLCLRTDADELAFSRDTPYAYVQFKGLLAWLARAVPSVHPPWIKQTGFLVRGAKNGYYDHPY